MSNSNQKCTPYFIPLPVNCNIEGASPLLMNGDPATSKKKIPQELVQQINRKIHCIPPLLPPSRFADTIANLSPVEAIAFAWQQHWNRENLKNLCWNQRIASAIAKDKRERDREDAQWREQWGDVKIIDGINFGVM